MGAEAAAARGVQLYEQSRSTSVEYRLGGAGGGDGYALTCRVTPAVFAWPVTVEAHELYRVQSPGEPVDMKELHDSRVLH